MKLLKWFNNKKEGSFFFNGALVGFLLQSFVMITTVFKYDISGIWNILYLPTFILTLSSMRIC